ncbi:MAG TPA: glycosyltransferase family 39 protein [Pyrinomonadaceae bacterium]|nr:glycosyltransferase family 39 protein [Pyrinomonadaceae bacterium]
MTRLTGRYKEEAQFLLAGDLTSFVKGSPSEPDTMILSHTPGYPIVIAAVYKLSGNSDRALRLFQIACEAVTAVLVFLIAARLVPRVAALIAALLVAVAPPLAYRSLVLLPDTLSALPLVAAIFLIAKAVEDRSVVKLFLAGGLIGVSAAWFRPDSVLLPLFLCAALLLLLPRGQRLRPMLALIGGAAILVAPITIRNVVVFHSFVPITLGTGQNLSAGIGDYDVEQRFGLPATDDGTCAQEAQLFGRPDYTAELYRPDGIERDRSRTARAWAVIRSEPAWFVGTMFRRVSAMLEYEPVSIISAEPTVSHSLEITKDTPVVWSLSPQELLSEADDPANEPQLVTKPITVKRNTDYFLTVPVSVQEGSASITIRHVGDSRILASAALPESLERVPYTNAYAPTVQMPFVTVSDDPVQVVIANRDSPAPRSNLDIGLIELIELGTASYLWTRYPRKLAKSVQKLFVTRYFFPLTIFGVLLLTVYRRKVALVLLLTLPLYYLASHAPIHFEYRYILPVYFFWFIFVGVAVYWLGVIFLTGLTKFTRWFAVI